MHLLLKKKHVFTPLLCPNITTRAFELLSDIAFNSNFPKKELEKEKIVVLDEINYYKDNPSELIFDEFEEQLFKNHSLGKNILGTPKHIRSFNKEMIENFISKNYLTNEIVISSVGNISMQKLIKVIEKYFAHIPQSKGKEKILHFQIIKHKILFKNEKDFKHIVF